MHSEIIPAIWGHYHIVTENKLLGGDWISIFWLLIHIISQDLLVLVDENVYQVIQLFLVSFHIALHSHLPSSWHVTIMVSLLMVAVNILGINIDNLTENTFKLDWVKKILLVFVFTLFFISNMCFLLFQWLSFIFG